MKQDKKGGAKKAKSSHSLFSSGHSLWGDTEEDKKDAETEARLKEEKDKEFEPLYMPIAPIKPADGSGDCDYNALNDEHFRLKRECENIESLRKQLKSKRLRALYSESEWVEKEEEAARRFAAYKTDCEAYSKKHEEVYSFRRLACEAVRYLSKIADSLDNIESSVSSIEDSVEE